MDKNEKIIQNIMSTMAIEGMELDKGDLDIISAFLNNSITEAQGIEMIKNEFRNN